MFPRSAVAAILGTLFLAGSLLAADKEVMGKLVSVNMKKSTLTLATSDGKKVSYEVNDETKFLGPKGGVSDKRLKDDRLVKGTELKLVVAGNNRTLRTVHLPERMGKKK